MVAQGLHAVALHGGRSQSEREAALRDFRNGSTNILVMSIAVLENLLLECQTSLRQLSVQYTLLGNFMEILWLLYIIRSS